MESAAQVEKVEQNSQTVLLYRPVGPGQLEAIVASGGRRFPGRQVNQKYFYPLLHESFAHWIAQHWQMTNSGIGYVTMFQVRRGFLDHRPVFRVGGPEHQEYRIPAAQLEEFNHNIVGNISVIAVYRQPSTPSQHERQRERTSDPVNDLLLALQ